MLYTTYTIQELTQNIQQVLRHHLSCVWVKGEIASITIASSGHWYISLKDSDSQIKAVMFKNKAMYASFTPKQGQQIEIVASVELYSARGEIQLVIDSIKPVGNGALYEAFITLKNKLNSLGMFDEEHKKTIPQNVQTIGVVTSLEAAALQDIIKNMYLKFPHIKIIIYPCLVQGMHAEASIIKQIDKANADNIVDVLIVTRGGGSLEDLSAYNQERLAMAIFNSDLPVISAVGHETDTTIADMVASYRASTPTASIDILGKTKLQYLDEVKYTSKSLISLINYYIDKEQQKLHKASYYLYNKANLIIRNLRNNHYAIKDSFAELNPKLKPVQPTSFNLQILDENNKMINDLTQIDINKNYQLNLLNMKENKLQKALVNFGLVKILDK
ncbi:MAG: hypothetical protein RLZZ210_730 [Pseudomonadota bacterium]